MTEHLVYIGLGSNIEPAHNLRLAIQTLHHAELPGNTRLLAVSSVWSSPPLGGQGPQFLNAAASLSTSLGAEELKTSVLRRIEAEQGRVRTADRNAARPLDIDLLLYDGEELDAEVWQAAHIALPLSQLLPGHAHPLSGEPLAEAAHRLAQSQPVVRCPLEIA